MINHVQENEGTRKTHANKMKYMKCNIIILLGASTICTFSIINHRKYKISLIDLKYLYELQKKR